MIDPKLYSNNPVTLSRDGKNDIEEEEEEDEEDEKNINNSQDTTLSYHENEKARQNENTNKGQLLNEEYVNGSKDNTKNSNNGRDRFNYNYYSNKGFDYTQIKYASGFAIGLIICSSVGFIFRKEINNSEVDFNGNVQDFHFTKANNLREKDEIVEVPFNANDYI